MPSAPALQLRVEGKKYGGWKSIRVTRTMEALCGSFALSVSEKWAGQGKVWPIKEEDECAVLIGDWPVVVGYVDRRSVSFSATDHALSVEGRDKTSALVDCSADLAQWEFKNVDLKAFAEKLCAPFGISVNVQSGLEIPRVAKLSVDPGESAFEALERACRLAGVLPVADSGDVLLTRSGSTRAVTALVEGENILAASLSCDATERFSKYKVLGQHRGSDDFFGEGAARVSGQAQDAGVRRTDRTRIVQADGNTTSAQAKRRAEWEAIVRAARAQTASVTVQGWTQGDGSLWPVNALVQVKSAMLGLDTDMLIVEAASLLDESGTTTQLSLKRPDAFLPEQTVKSQKGGRGSSPWDEIKGGV